MIESIFALVLLIAFGWGLYLALQRAYQSNTGIRILVVALVVIGCGSIYLGVKFDSTSSIAFGLFMFVGAGATLLRSGGFISMSK